jgi:hypothetical protein
MAIVALGALPVGDYLVLALLIVAFLLAGLVRLVALLVRGDRPEADPEREHYADEAD